MPTGFEPQWSVTGWDGGRHPQPHRPHWPLDPWTPQPAWPYRPLDPTDPWTPQTPGTHTLLDPTDPWTPQTPGPHRPLDLRDPVEPLTSSQTLVLWLPTSRCRGNWRWNDDHVSKILTITNNKSATAHMVQVFMHISKLALYVKLHSQKACTHCSVYASVSSARVFNRWVRWFNLAWSQKCMVTRGEK